MPKLSFILKETGAGKDAPILLLYTCYNGRLKYYTGETAKSLVNLSKGTKAILNRIESHVEQAVIDAKIKGEPLYKESLKDSLDVLLHKKRKISSGNMFDAMTEVVNKMEVGELLTPSKKRYSAGSVKTFRFTIMLLQKFNPSMTLSTITIETYSSFIRWMQQSDYSINYIGSQIKNWKTLGKAIGGQIFSNPAFKKIQEQTHDVYLNEKELDKIYHLKLPGRESVVRDWFILDCYTGLRVSDLVLLSEKNYSNGYITIANKKTGERVHTIPAYPFCMIAAGEHGCRQVIYWLINRGVIRIYFDGAGPGIAGKYRNTGFAPVFYLSPCLQISGGLLHNHCFMWNIYRVFIV